MWKKLYSYSGLILLAVLGADVWFSNIQSLTRPKGQPDYVGLDVRTAPTPQKPIAQNTQPTVTASVPPAETPEAKAVRLAEEFIARNGYTDLPPDKTAISHETIEFAANLEQLLKSRRDTLERKAYGLCYRGRLGAKGGWMIIFRAKNVSDNYYKMVSQLTGRPVTKESFPIGRCVTMDANFKNLLVEHKIFPLGNVDKKLQ